MNAAILLNQGDLDSGDVFVRAATEADANDCMTHQMQVSGVGDFECINICVEVWYCCPPFHSYIINGSSFVLSLFVSV